jgi:excisionase family DNA binding protein
MWGFVIWTLAHPWRASSHFTPKIPLRRSVPKMAEHQLSQLLSKRQAAKILGISAASVDRAIARGDLPAYRIGNLVRIRLIDLAKFQQADPVRMSAE